MKTENEFPKFWYESNACWGNVESLEELNEKAELQLEESNCIYSIDDFLDKSLQAYFSETNYGTRIEHTGKKTLRDFLSEHNLLDDFLTLHNKK